ncbi:MAG: 2-hydroxyacyl-CoA dehydratase [Eubacterium sp.]|nr:2-hydroxyacyl-CoA dehydratase [Eubacterium sp.]
MSQLVEKFGNYVNTKIETNPDAARKLLLAAYRAKLVQLRHFPDKRLSRARDLMAVESMKAVIAPLAHPERSALVSIFTPCELLQCAGIAPMFAEAMASYITGADAEAGFAQYAEGCGIPETYCSYHKILLGGILSGVIPKPKFIVNTSLVCDANNLTFRKAAETFQIPQFYLDVPYEVSEDSVRYVARQMRDLKKWIEEQTGRQIPEDRLKERIACGKRTIESLRICQNSKAGRYLSNDLTDELYEVFGAHVLLGTPAIESFAGMLAGELKQMPAYNGVRLLWVHTIPYYQKVLRGQLNFSMRAQVVSCDMNYCGLVDMDPEQPYESMARRMVYNTFNGPAERRIQAALEQCDSQQIDGVVYFCHWGCKQTLAAAGNARAMFETAGYPVLILDGDGCDRRNAGDGQTLTRMQAFIEMLEQKKQR